MTKMQEWAERWGKVGRESESREWLLYSNADDMQDADATYQGADDPALLLAWVLDELGATLTTRPNK